MNDKIEDLLRHKSIDQLDEDERAAVLEEMSLAEYDRLHRVLTALRIMDTDATPPSGLRGRLLAHGRKQRHFQSSRNAWWQRRIPVWQAAAALLFVIVAGYFFEAGKPPRIQEKWVEKIVFQRDTMVQTDTLWRSRLVVRYREENSPHGSARLADTTRIDPSPQAAHAATGTPIGDMPALMEFLGGVDN